MSVTTPAPVRAWRRGTVRKLATYTAGSVVAAGCSELALVGCYGLLHLSTGVSSTVAWIAGALPNYWLNRSWTWQQRGRPSLRREVLPYVAVILATLLLAIVTTHAVAGLLDGRSAATRTTAVAVTFLGVYVVMFLARYLLLDRLFARLGTTPTTSRRLATDGAGAFHQATGRSLEEDASGADRRRYRAYQLELLSPHFGPSVLEVGAGLGEFAAQLSGLSRHVVTDVDPGAVASMAERFADRPEVEARRLDLDDPTTLDIGQPVSTVVAINVLEHIEDDAGALRRLAELVEPGGRVVMFVPGYQQLYGEFDRLVGHVRRYTPRTLRASFEAAGLRPVDVKPVNLLGGVAWWATVRRGGVGAPNPRLVRAYDRYVVPTTRFLERRVTPPFGQSVLGAAVVPG